MSGADWSLQDIFYERARSEFLELLTTRWADSLAPGEWTDDDARQVADQISKAVLVAAEEIATALREVAAHTRDADRERASA